MINPKQATFASLGKVSTHILPGAYSRFGSSGQAIGFSSTGNLVFLGTVGGPEPYKLHWFSTLDDAKELVFTNSMLEILREAFDPGDDLIPQRIAVMPINSSTQSSAQLLATAAPIIDLTSVLYGDVSKLIAYKLEDGTIAGSKKVTEKYGNEERVTRDIIRPSFSIIYTGAGTTAVITITGTTLTTTIGVATTDALDITLADYPTLSELVSYISTAKAGVYTVVLLTAPEALSTELDAVTAVDIKTVALTLHSNVQAVIDAINSELGFLTAALTSAAVRTMPDNVTTLTRLTAGADGTSTATEWGVALTALQMEDIQLIGTDVATAATSVLIKSHVALMNSVEGKSERQAILGGETSLAASQIQSVSLNNRAVNVCWMEFKNYNNSGVLTDFTSVHYAAKLLGQASALSLNEPMTHKALSVISCSTKLTKTQKEQAVLAGVVVPEVTPSGVVRTVRSITSSQSTDLKDVEFSIVREMLYITRDLRTLQEDTFTGKAGITGRLISVESVSRNRLIDYETDLEIIMADPKAPVAKPAFWDLTWEVVGDKILTKFHARVVSPINFQFVTALFEVLATT